MRRAVGKEFAVLTPEESLKKQRTGMQLKLGQQGAESVEPAEAGFTVTHTTRLWKKRQQWEESWKPDSSEATGSGRPTRNLS